MPVDECCAVREDHWKRWHGGNDSAGPQANSACSKVYSLAGQQVKQGQRAGFIQLCWGFVVFPQELEKSLCKTFATPTLIRPMRNSPILVISQWFPLAADESILKRHQHAVIGQNPLAPRNEAMVDTIGIYRGVIRNPGFS